jgi:hypothetical protein
MLSGMIVKSIAQAIGQSGKSRYQISKETGIDQAVLCRIVNNEICSMATAEKLCEYFGLELRPRRTKGR